MNDNLFKRHVLRAVNTYKKLLDTHYGTGDPVEELSRKFGISRYVLQQGFRKTYGEGVREYKLRIRMEFSRHLLDNGKDVKEVAQELNYAEARAFTTAFKKYFGYTPTVFCRVLN
jgi:AraC-like DNA-binding protein